MECSHHADLTDCDRVWMDLWERNKVGYSADFYCHLIILLAAILEWLDVDDNGQLGEHTVRLLLMVIIW